tara:strand:+ start:107 stop:289 length:183 start_codon:yes stop_codon:yes gene_type:complete
LRFPIWNSQVKVLLDFNIYNDKETPLLKAALKVFSQHHLVKENFGLIFKSDISFRVGLAG